MRTYINSLDRGNTPFLEELEQTALRDRVPVIRREMQSFIKTFLAMNQPGRILEVGTAIGFSTLLMCEYGREDLQIVTIENYDKRIPIARENFRRITSLDITFSGSSPSITILMVSGTRIHMVPVPRILAISVYPIPEEKAPTQP